MSMFSRSKLSESILIRFSPEQVAAMKAEAERRGVSVSDLIRTALDQLLLTGGEAGSQGGVADGAAGSTTRPSGRTAKTKALSRRSPKS
jgi:ribbon-helix-helix CopG family protein